MLLGLEVPVFGAISASRAIELGAARVELNASGSYPAGGLTPTIECLEDVADANVPLRIMIRPRGPPPPNAAGRDFVYSAEEIDQMDASIRCFKATGLLKLERGDGFVFGALREDTSPSIKPGGRNRCRVDKDACKDLVETARPFKAVFHRAYDEIVSCDERSPDKERAAWEMGLDDIVECGFDAVLTSGGLGHAAQNIPTLGKIIAKARDLGAEIIVGGGVRRHNVGEMVHQLNLKESTSVSHVHSACLDNPESLEIDGEELTAILSALKDTV
ncbi:hypothetical protein GGS23DRAFT_437367 [Durotheca rogersii]|uniref:uncharacterized protein n=1 Tax=Durotheca rogersii TaxID=419775 RepID=UPI00222113E9|nr:uncharacterized protein GGS23DRAFT_437367 [Durotheca rogersii]KAI5865665.1 hypothetical protein GGS23DRAFT_437367 [Durotheca rogersii]